MDAARVMEEVLKDKPYFDTTGGGVTFSGGECMLQTDFLLDLLMACRDQKVRTAVDTAGNVPFESFQRINPYADLYLYDIKCVTPSLHRSLTGVDNARILDNYKRLWALSPEKLIVRVPVVPGYNTVEGELERIARFLREYPPVGYELVPYHALGNAKRAALDLPAFEAPLPDEGAMESYRQSFALALSAADI
jgi:pyruvate formate lyase activating enzyme